VDLIAFQFRVLVNKGSLKADNCRFRTGKFVLRYSAESSRRPRFHSRGVQTEKYLTNNFDPNYKEQTLFKSENFIVNNKNLDFMINSKSRWISKCRMNQIYNMDVI
jgi:hypothetical protein